jgi:TetR/AcrR family transcriptional repressor of mexCD-oprJ operon
MTRRPRLRDRITAGILDTAAAVLAERGDSASMAEIAEAAGVGRATLYRYFPSREALLAELANAAYEELCDRIEGAGLDDVDVREGIARLSRGFVAAGAKYVALLRGGPVPVERKLADPTAADRRLAEPVRVLLRRGIDDGTLRTDIPPEILLDLFTGLLEKVFQLVAQNRLGTEQAAAAVTSLFLDGTART